MTVINSLKFLHESTSYILGQEVKDLTKLTDKKVRIILLAENDDQIVSEIEDGLIELDTSIAVIITQTAELLDEVLGQIGQVDMLILDSELKCGSSTIKHCKELSNNVLVISTADQEIAKQYLDGGAIGRIDKSEIIPLIKQLSSK